MPTRYSNRPPSVERVTFWRGRGPDAIEFIKGSYKNFAFSPHSHDRYMIGLIVQGAIEVVDTKDRAIVSDGQITFYNFDEFHWGEAATDEGWTILATYVPSIILHEIAREISASPKGTISFSGITTTNPQLARTIADLYTHCDIEHESLTRSSLLVDIVGEALVHHSKRNLLEPDASNEHRAVKVTRDFLNGNFSQNVSLEELAGECDVSRYWLIKAFKSTWGIPPYAYLTNVRVRHATSLLRKGEPPAEVAYKCGFADQSHFTRTFKRSLGVTPGKFRAR